MLKSTITIDHLSKGRVILGIGAGWWPEEHSVAGLEFGSSPDERLRWLDEALVAMRAMRCGDMHTHVGHYRFRSARVSPTPIRNLPFLVGGGGERMTLRLVARYADIWNIRGSEADVRRKTQSLVELCAELGRDLASIGRTASSSAVIRDNPSDALEVWELAMAKNRNPLRERLPALQDPDGVRFGPPHYIASRLGPYVSMGFRHLIMDTAAPYGIETIERLTREVMPLLADRRP